MSLEGQNKNSGLFESVSTLAGTLLAMGQTRLELLSNDLEEERAWLSSMLVWTLIALFCAALAIVLSTLLVVVIFWDNHRLLALGSMIGIFIIGAGFAWHILCNMTRSKPRLFSASLGELTKDREQLSAPPHEQKN